MSKKKKYSIRANLKKSPNYFVRGSRRDGSRYEFAIPIAVEPPVDTPKELYQEKRLALENQARECSEIFFRREWGELDAEECECRLKGVSQRVTRQDSKVNTCYFFVAWVWEHVLRGKLHPNRAGKIARVMYALLKRIGLVASKTIHQLRAEHFEIFILERRIRGCSPAVANDEVILLQSIAKDIKAKTGVDLAVGLELEDGDTQERMPLSHDEVTRIFAAVYVMGVYAIQWTTFLIILLYTQMRPEDAAILQRKDVDLEAGTIRFIAQKLEGFGRKFPPKPLHKALWNYLRDMLAELQLKPDDYLCPHIALKLGNSLNDGFIRILKAAHITNNKALAPNRKNEWSEKSLYSLRSTGITWMAAAGAGDEEQKLELGDSTTKALRAYQHPNDPMVMEAQHRRVNQMPAVNVTWPPTAGASGHEQKRPSRDSATNASDTAIQPNDSPEIAKRRRRINSMPGVVVKWTT